MAETLHAILATYSLLAALVVVGLLMWVSAVLSEKLTRGRLHGSAIAIFLGLVLAWGGGAATGGSRGVADFPVLAGVGLLGGPMLRDLAIVATAFGVRPEALRTMGVVGVLSIFLGVVAPFAVGAGVAWVCGYRDAVSLATIGAGSVTYIVGGVTGASLGASSEVIALSVAAGLVKAILVMLATPHVAKFIGLDNPRTAMIFGGLLGTTSGVTAGLAATDPRLVPYGAMTSTFHTGVGCLLCPSALYFLTRLVA